jgi:predicted membrane protein
MNCLDTIAVFLFSALIIDATVEALDWIHRLYEAEESIEVLVLLASGKLYYSLIVGQAFLGTVIPLLLLGSMLVFKDSISEHIRRICYTISSVLILLGVFAMRWNVVIGGQLFSKSLRGFTVYKVELIGSEGLLMALFLLFLPFFVLWILFKIFPAEDAHQP